MIARVVMSTSTGDSSVVINPNDLMNSQTEGIITMQLADAFDHRARFYSAPRFTPQYDYDGSNRMQYNVPRDATHDLDTPRRKSTKEKLVALTKWAKSTRSMVQNSERYSDMQMPGWVPPQALPVHHYPVQATRPMQDFYSSNASVASFENRVDPTLEGRSVSATTFVHDNAAMKLSSTNTMPIAIKAPKKPQEWETLEKTLVMDFD
jgi:hypothetical protein